MRKKYDAVVHVCSDSDMIVPVIAMAIALERYIARGLLVGAIKG